MKRLKTILSIMKKVHRAIAHRTVARTVLRSARSWPTGGGRVLMGVPGRAQFPLSEQHEMIRGARQGMSASPRNEHRQRLRPACGPDMAANSRTTRGLQGRSAQYSDGQHELLRRPDFPAHHEAPYRLTSEPASASGVGNVSERHWPGSGGPWCRPWPLRAGSRHSAAGPSSRARAASDRFRTSSEMIIFVVR